MKSVAIVVQNIIQWYSVRPLVQLLSQNNLNPDIIVFDPITDENGYHKIAESLQNAIKKDGFTASMSPKKEGYKVCLSPYSDMINFPTQYRLGYHYGSATTKPLLTLQPESKKDFHGMFLHDAYGAELLSVYSRTYLVPNLNLKQPKHISVSKKPVVLYLPTYNDPSTIEVAKALSKLKDKYYIITKGHHGTEFLNTEQSKKDILYQIADECYGSDQSINNLFEKADVVLSDNSCAAMDALYVKIPVAVATATIMPGPNNIKSLHQELIDDGVIPYTDSFTKESLESIINQALKTATRKIQSTTSDKLFPNKTGGAKAWFSIIKKYLNDEIDQNYCKLHDYYVQYTNNLLLENVRLKQIEKDFIATSEELSAYKQSRAHQLVDKALKRRHENQTKKTNNN
ncbi:hypothetical protein IKF12_03480 [Candidatus Saccharibacteria bacterium]|nr:hypothetical protein [Candidatus Saccharibacteria bacterium]